jgi:LysR family transcriptional regulator for bpeEF and oprC
MPVGARNNIKKSTLRPILTGWKNVMRLHIVYPPNRHLSNTLRVLLDWAVEILTKGLRH